MTKRKDISPAILVIFRAKVGAKPILFHMFGFFLLENSSRPKHTDAKRVKQRDAF